MTVSKCLFSSSRPPTRICRPCRAVDVLSCRPGLVAALALYYSDGGLFAQTTDHLGPGCPPAVLHLLEEKAEGEDGGRQAGR